MKYDRFDVKNGLDIHIFAMQEECLDNVLMLCIQETIQALVDVDCPWVVPPGSVYQTQARWLLACGECVAGIVTRGTCEVWSATAQVRIEISNLTDAQYRFSVAAQDEAGNAGSPVVFVWNVDTTPPETVIHSGPHKLTNTLEASFIISAAGEDPSKVLPFPALFGIFFEEYK